MTTYFNEPVRAIIAKDIVADLHFGQTGDVIFKPDASQFVTFIPDGYSQKEYNVKFEDLYFPNA